MGWVFIDTSRPDHFRIGLLSAKRRELWEGEGRSRLALNEIGKHISRTSLQNADGVCVVAGPGSFSAVRTGVVTANMLSRLYQKPLVGISVDDAFDLDLLTTRLLADGIPSTGYVAPVYDSEPNITMPKPA
jgi:tRNA A37 threonylcarbamoyladenosine modification protein TsaB